MAMVTAPKLKPILFSALMVRAILYRGKSQTRRLLGPALRLMSGVEYPNPFGVPGDRLWVRESWRRDEATGRYIFAADGPIAGHRWKPSIHMPREACRIELIITALHTERLQDLTDGDAIAEGVFQDPGGFWSYGAGSMHATARMAYADLWDRINPDDLWETNPTVRVVTFKLRDLR